MDYQQSEEKGELLKALSLHLYEEFCCLDVLGISERDEIKNETFLSYLKDQLCPDRKGFYERALI